MPDADESKRIRAERKTAGLCIACGTKKPEKNRVTCRVCLDHVAAWQRADFQKNRSKYAERARERTAKLRSLGICIECTTTVAAQGRAKCVGCLANSAARAAKVYAKKAQASS